jgi:hypothetical protein
MGETCWGLNIKSEAYMLSFSTPTQTHVSDVHSHGYGHFGTTTFIKRVGAFGTVMHSGKTDFLNLLLSLVD